MARGLGSLVAGGFIDDFNLYFDPKPFSRNGGGKAMTATFASEGKSGWISPLSPQRH
ncbi:hypothetical protein [Jiella marina]|uniref:hypothetical protein n=1 Tax=Jiella sp. LLJ827 TaxID=2917712 RepID=UPI002100D417|nr:hypothetical protein [Jiella sp. LLJ827]MCQ0988063.1 hypothetical protein [Jiella sp. LLJ827]